MVRLAVILFALLVLAFSPAHAQPGLTGAGGNYPPPSGATFTGPLDVYNTTTKACYSVRACSASIASGGTQKMFRVINETSSEQCDFLPAASGAVGVAANCTASSNGVSLSTFAGAATVKLVTWYDQLNTTGANVTQATDADRPTMTLSCTNSKPCFVSTGSPIGLLSGTITAVNTPLTYSFVINHTATSPTFGVFVSEGTAGAGIAARGLNTANTFDFIVGGVDASYTASNSAWHAVQNDDNNTNTIANVDGTETTLTGIGSGSGATTRGVFQDSGAANPTASDLAEVIVYGSDMGSTATRNNMCHNQRLYFSTGGSC